MAPDRESAFAAFTQRVNVGLWRSLLRPSELRLDQGPSHAEWRYSQLWASIQEQSSGKLSVRSGKYGRAIDKYGLSRQSEPDEKIETRVSDIDEMNPASAKTLVRELSQSFEPNASYQRLLWRTGFFIWSVLMAAGLLLSLLQPIIIECGGGQHIGLWAYPVILGFWFLIFSLVVLVGLSIYFLAKNEPEAAGNLRFLPGALWLLVEPAYRAAPLMFTVALVMLLPSLWTQYWRYDLRIHADRHYTLVHDRLYNSWKAYYWSDCQVGDAESP